ncbi:plastid movement impaired1 [Carex rostrata]
MSGRRSSSSGNNQILQELDALSHSMYQAHTSRRTASLVLPRTEDPMAADVAKPNDKPDPVRLENRPRSRRLSVSSPWRSRPKSHHEEEEDNNLLPSLSKIQSMPATLTVIEKTTASEKKGIWNWKPMRALSHIRMQRLGCLFSVEVVAIQGLPASMNGLRLAVSVRKKETKDGAVQTMPARVLQGSVEFEETLFIRCHVYCSGGAGTGKPLKLEERLFVLSILAIDAPELDFGKKLVDLSSLVKESVEKLSSEGARVRQWDMKFPLIGKAKGGELMVKLGFQIMEDGGVGLYNQADKSIPSSSSSSAYARKQSKSSFSVSSPKVSRSEPSFTPTRDLSVVDLKGIDEFSLDGPGQDEPEAKDELELPEFEVVDKGVEVLDEVSKNEDKTDKTQQVEEVEPVEKVEEVPVTNEVVKEVVHDSAHLTRVNELEAIAQQIQALESIMTVGVEPEEGKVTQENETVQLDADEETVTKEFLQLLETEDAGETEFDTSQVTSANWSGMDKENAVYISDLGKGLGPVVQTRDGGYLASMNPFDVEVEKKDMPKLAMQISKPFIITDQNLTNGFEFFQRLATVGVEELGSKLFNMAAMDELMGKTAEQIAFEGMASVIISGRSKEIASSSAARSVAALKTMGMASSEVRKQRILTGIWNAKEESVTIDEILAVSLQKIENMAVEALKVQADMAEEQAPFDVSALPNKSGEKDILDSMIPPEEWVDAPVATDSVAMVVIIQLRDPLRRYETVGAPAIAVIQASRVEGNGNEDEARYKVASLHVGGVKIRSGIKRSIWDAERQRLTAMHWLVAYGLGKAGRKSAKGALQGKGGADLLWSISSRIMADMWLKSLRNPDVKLPEK